MNKNIDWFFANVGGGGEEGFKHAGMNHFGSEPQKYISRETIQNSLDAKDSSLKEPVIVEFNRFSASINDALPNLSQYKKILEKCRESSKIGKDVEAQKFFTRALSTCQKQKINILKISDYGSVGISGINSSVGRWHNLIKMKGTSVAEGKVGGTFGIGKSAPFTTSGLRTILYYTKNKEGETGFIWKAIFTSHGSSPKKRNEGYFCQWYESNQDIITEGFISDSSKYKPSFINRDSIGTDIYILDHLFEDPISKNPWNVFYEKQVMENYFISIYDNELKVVFKDQKENRNYEINRSNILEKFKKHYDSLDERNKVNSNYPMLKAYQEKPILGQIEGLGECKLFVRLDDKYHKKVGYMRSPKSLVFSRKNHNYSGGYSALFLCENNKGNSFLSKMEDPTHEEWSYNWHSDKKLAQKILRRITIFINEKLRALEETNTQNSFTLDGFEFLTFEEDNSNNLKDLEKKSGDLESASDGFELDSIDEPFKDLQPYKPPKKSKRRPKRKEKTEEGFSSGDDSQIEGSGGKSDNPVNPEPPNDYLPGPDILPGGEKGKGIKLKKLSSNQYDYKCFFDSSSEKYSLIVNTNSEKECNIHIYAMGLDVKNNEELHLESVTNLKGEDYDISGNAIKNVELSKIPLKLQIKLKNQHRYVVHVEVFEL